MAVSFLMAREGSYKYGQGIVRYQIGTEGNGMKSWDGWTDRQNDR